VELTSTHPRYNGRWYLYAGASIFVSALVYYAVFRSQLPWPGHLINSDWARLSHLTDLSNGSYPSFAFALSMGLIAIGLFVTQRSLAIKAILGVWAIGLWHELFISTLTLTDVLAGTLGAVIALRVALFATRASFQSATTCKKATPLFARLTGFSDRTKLAALMLSSIVFATGTSPYEPRTSTDCLETDVNGTCISTSSYRSPVYLSYTDLRSAVKVSEARALTSVSRIYLYDNYIFANELNEGIHIIDNSIPSAPKKLGFIEIPGNQDIAVRDNSLYADSYIDLVTIDISDIDNVREIARIEDVFPYNSRQNIPNNIELSGNIDRSLGVVVGFQ